MQTHQFVYILLVLCRAKVTASNLGAGVQ